MYSTRRLLQLSPSSISKYNSHEVMQLPPRSNWDTFQSAIQGVYSIFTHPEGRDTFVQNIDKGIINPTLGLLMSFALHHDLNAKDGILKKYKFDAEEFMEGSHVAVETFQECLYRMDKKIIHGIEQEIEKNQSLLSSSLPSSLSSTIDDVENDGAIDLEGELEKMTKRKEIIDQIVNEQMKIKQKTQDEDDESVEYQFKQMVSKQFLDTVETQFAASVVQCYLSDLLRMDYRMDSGKILNVSLMSARAYEVPPDVKDEPEKTLGDDESLVDDSLTDHNDDEEYPVVAQIEVLYTISQTFARKKIGDKEVAAGLDNHEEEGKEEEGVKSSDTEEEAREKDSKESTMETSWVGIFEGCFNGKHPLRWKLVDNRPAWEFPAVSSN